MPVNGCYVDRLLRLMRMLPQGDLRWFLIHSRDRDIFPVIVIIHCSSSSSSTSTSSSSSSRGRCRYCCCCCWFRLRRYCRLLSSLGPAIDQVPAAPALDVFPEAARHARVLGAEQLHEVLGVHENRRLLLALDGEAVLLGRLEVLPHLRLGGRVHVVVGQAAQARGILVGGLDVRLLGTDDLPVLEERDPSLVPLPRAVGVVHVELETGGRLLRGGYRGNVEIPVIVFGPRYGYY